MKTTSYRVSIHIDTSQKMCKTVAAPLHMRSGGFVQQIWMGHFRRELRLGKSSGLLQEAGLMARPAGLDASGPGHAMSSIVPITVCVE